MLLFAFKIDSWDNDIEVVLQDKKRKVTGNNMKYNISADLKPKSIPRRNGPMNSDVLDKTISRRNVSMDSDNIDDNDNISVDVDSRSRFSTGMQNDSINMEMMKNNISAEVAPKSELFEIILCDSVDSSIDIISNCVQRGK
jgi:hypothetical protein